MRAASARECSNELPVDRLGQSDHERPAEPLPNLSIKCLGRVREDVDEAFGGQTPYERAPENMRARA
jgi:hypothetical protein